MVNQSFNSSLNFSAGPSGLPDRVVNEIRKELKKSNSIIEISHRSKEFDDLLNHTKDLLRFFMGIPGNYEILFMHGGATAQFAAVPYNLWYNESQIQSGGWTNRDDLGKGAYAISGLFSTKAYQEAMKFSHPYQVATSLKDGYTTISEIFPDDLSPETSYVHICYNNTVYGTQYQKTPEVYQMIPLVADMSSCICTDTFEVSDFGVIYAGAQKNLGVAGMGVVIVRRDLLNRFAQATPSVLNWTLTADKNSMNNTPPCFNIFVLNKVLQNLVYEFNDLEEVSKYNHEKSKILYDVIDNSKIFKGIADPDFRSTTNVTFTTGNPDLDAEFIKHAGYRDVIGIKGHRSVSGMRASLYNSVPKESVVKLVEIMKEFERSCSL